MGFPIHLALAILFADEPWVAMTIAGIASFDQREIRREIPLHRALFNRSPDGARGGCGDGPVHHLPDSTPMVFVRRVAAAGSASARQPRSRGARGPLRSRSSDLGDVQVSASRNPLSGFAVSYVLLTGLGLGDRRGAQGVRGRSRWPPS